MLWRPEQHVLSGLAPGEAMEDSSPTLAELWRSSASLVNRTWTTQKAAQVTPTASLSAVKGAAGRLSGLPEDGAGSTLA